MAFALTQAEGLKALSPKKELMAENARLIFGSLCQAAVSQRSKLKTEDFAPSVADDLAHNRKQKPNSEISKTFTHPKQVPSSSLVPKKDRSNSDD